MLYFAQEDTLKWLERKFSEDIKKLRNYETPARGNESIICPEKNEELLSLEGQEKYRKISEFIGVNICIKNKVL